MATTTPPRKRTGKLSEPSVEASPTVLLMVDFINPLSFDGAEQLAPCALRAAAATARLRRELAARSKRMPLCIYANDNYGVWRSDFKALWLRCSRMPGEAGRMARILKPKPGDCTVLKPRHSAFYETPLDILLRQVRCKRLIVTGLAADSCVLFTAMDAYVRGYELWVPSDCVASETAEAASYALGHMERVLKAAVSPAFQPQAHATPGASLRARQASQAGGTSVMAASGRAS
ncbi:MULTISPECIES: cysteine hydrolase family protein [unclassified Rhizobacter]|uniref:cysteine hydrolase family protein n=1 Tax=unclassified Rhizobacter TaxID=2640088 RepID=UPI0009EA4B72|nr:MULTISPECIES: isochorismatase family cysteine hydrolase [unclassified Rhizobacter]